MFATAITTASNFFHFAAVFIYQNALLIMAVLLVLTALNGIRKHAVKVRKRRAMKRRAVAQKSVPAVRQPTFDPFDKITF